MKLLLFLDTEYTGLGKVDPKLISIALVPENGRNAFYAELKKGEDWDTHDCADFVIDTVLPLLKGGEYSLNQSELKKQLLNWLTSMPRSIQIACDSKTDFQFLKQVLGEYWPEKLDRNYFDLRPLIDTNVYDRTVQNCYNDQNPPHNALNDARSYQRGWQAWMSEKIGAKF